MPLRFVILKHDHPFLHWDLLLQEESSARAWRLLRKPCLSEPIAVEPLPAHRLMYLDFEGDVSGNRGRVERMIAGRYEAQETSDGLILTLLGTSFAASARLQTFAGNRGFITFYDSTCQL